MLLSDLLAASIVWRPEAGDTILLAAVESDLPVVETVLALLPAKARGRVFVEVESADRVGHLTAPARVGITWLVRERGQSLGRAVDAYLDEMLPVEFDREHRVYAWRSGDRAAHAITTTV